MIPSVLDDSLSRKQLFGGKHKKEDLLRYDGNDDDGYVVIRSTAKPIMPCVCTQSFHRS